MRISLLISALALFLVFNSAPANAYTDVPKTHKNYEDITYLLERNITEQRSEYGINDIVTREDVAVMIAKALQLAGTPRATKFSDVPASHKNSGYIQSAVEAGIINGYDDGTFKPNGKITRGHMATFIARAFTLPAGSQAFIDVSKGHTAYDAVQQLAASGITTGYEDGTFRPAQNLSRAHISAFLTRALVYNDIHSFDVEQFLQSVYTNDNLDAQLTQLNEQQTTTATLLEQENDALNTLISQKKELEAAIAAKKEQLNPLQQQVEIYHATISAANAEIAAYRTNNKHLVNGTAKQKEGYLQMLEALQTAYAYIQKDKEAVLAKRDQLHAQYTKQQASLNQLRATIQTKQQLVNKQKEIAAALKTATTDVNTKIAAIEQEKEREQVEKERELAQQEREAQQKLAQQREEQQQLAQKQWEEQQRELEKQRELARIQWEEHIQNQQDFSYYNPATEATPTELEDFVDDVEQYEEPALDADAIEEEVVALVNEERAKEGLSPLQIDRPLMDAAREKSQDMSDYDYFDHTSPTWGSPFDRLGELGITFNTAGENIAYGQRTAEQVMTSWMNSPGHRANILNGHFTHIGVGFVEDGYYWTQQFISK